MRKADATVVPEAPQAPAPPPAECVAAWRAFLVAARREAERRARERLAREAEAAPREQPPPWPEPDPTEDLEAPAIVRKARRGRRARGEG